jgi:hypothetical protein
MANTKNSAELLQRALELVEIYGSVTNASKQTGIARSTLQSQLKNAEKRKIEVSTEEIEFPNLPSSEPTAEELITQACKRFESHQRARDARRWMEIKVKSNKPIGICFMGDPHVDNPGCNWPQLKRDISILENTDGMYAVNIGDLTDNWVGRLIRLYADQEMSKKQAWKLAKYLIRDAKIKWLCHILGNHDMWNDGPYLIKANAHPTVPVEEWQSRFQVVFPNDARIRVHVAHDFPGTSIWNSMHGPKRASMLWEEADIFACGHKHNWEIQEGENANRDYVYWLIRARGYKAIDHYADQRGYGSQKYGSSIVAIVDPSSKGPSKIRCIPDLEEAAEYLTWKRSK